MARLKTQHLEELIGSLNKKRRDAVTFADVLSLAEITAQSLQVFFETMDTAVYREMREIAGYIEKMRNEIGALQADDIQQSRIPAAGQELSAIVQATESATHTIMNCAEALMGADRSDPAAFANLVQEKVIVIFEACSFQDITGQRIAKVIETLQHIERRVSRFASAVSARVDMSLADQDYASEEERARAERKQRLLLHGPQSAAQAIKQSDVDALIAGSGTTAQDTIDDVLR
jgi:chemotaxis protein CheZ